VEVDAIVQLRDGRWGAIEIKLGEGQVEAAAAGLLGLNPLEIANEGVLVAMVPPEYADAALAAFCYDAKIAFFRR